VIIEAHRRVSELFDAPPLLVLAPRYPEQCEAIARSIDRNVMLRSKGRSPLPSTEVFIVDTLGRPMSRSLVSARPDRETY